MVAIEAVGAENETNEEADGDVLAVEDEGKVVVFTSHNEEEAQDEIPSIELLSMSMDLDQNNFAFNFDWIDTLFEKVDTIFDSFASEEESVTTTSTLPATIGSETTIPNEADDFFSWVELEEDKETDDDASLEFSLSMVEEISVDYTWTELSMAD